VAITGTTLDEVVKIPLSTSGTTTMYFKVGASSRSDESEVFTWTYTVCGLETLSLTEDAVKELTVKQIPGEEWTSIP